MTNMNERKREIRDSNNLKTTIHWICSDCGNGAKKLLENHHCGHTSISTFHEGKCDVCQETKPITQTRDYGWPDFTNFTPQIIN